ncbi:MAG: hypothetical protein LBC13_03340 [Clostridiales bacterium]|nr:hypothetical protein [Clostridiales bacterium]
MDGIEIAVAVVAALIVAGSVVLAVIRRKKGKTSCGCDIGGKKPCGGGCPGCAYGTSQEETDKD